MNTMGITQQTKIRSGAKLAVREARQEMEDESTELLDLFCDMINEEFMEDFDWDDVSDGPYAFRDHTEQRLVFELRMSRRIGRSDHRPYRPWRQPARGRHRLSSQPPVRMSHDDPPLFRETVEDRARREREAELQELGWEFGVDGYSVETKTRPVDSSEVVFFHNPAGPSEFDWMFNPMDYID